MTMRWESWRWTGEGEVQSADELKRNLTKTNTTKAIPKQIHLAITDTSVYGTQRGVVGSLPALHLSLDPLWPAGVGMGNVTANQTKT